MSSYVLGLSCYYHDSAAALLKDGEIISAAQEERFSRKKHDSSFPKNAVSYCLKSQKISLSDIKEIVYYEKPLITFERLLETYLGTAPRGGRSFVAAMQVWLKEKLFLKTELKKNLKAVQNSLGFHSLKMPSLLFSEHHLCFELHAVCSQNFFGSLAIAPSQPLDLHLNLQDLLE